jgi:alpha-1,2-mannosyltransferase
MKLKVSIVALLSVIAVFFVYLAATRNKFFDSNVYFGAIRYWFNGDGMVYDWMYRGTPYGFTYPPFAGLAMSPMAILPVGTVIVLATIATVATTALLVWWLAGPLIRRKGWTVWFGLAVATCLAIAFEPVRETITFGQVNTLLLALVVGDMLFGVARGRQWAGVGIGLATAVKLTPGIFLLYLLITRRWRAAATAAGTAAGATMLTGLFFPDETREFWTSALLDTNRVGRLYYVSNQSWRGMLARWDFGLAEPKIWMLLVLLTLAFWAWRVFRMPGDVLGGLAVTGVAGCLISPVTWVHHYVWVLPAIIICIDRGLTGPSRRLLCLGGAAYLLMTSHLTWLWERPPTPPLEVIGSNVYVWFGLALLIWTPLAARRSAPVHEPELVSV